MGFVTSQQRATFMGLGLGQGCIAHWPLRDTALHSSLQGLGDDWDPENLGGQLHSCPQSTGAGGGGLEPSLHPLFYRNRIENEGELGNFNPLLTVIMQNAAKPICI